MNGFTPFGKLARLSRECVITEKIDGTNAQVAIFDYAGLLAQFNGVIPVERVIARDGHDIHDGGLWMLAGSRTRYLDTSSKGDNFGFAKWVADNAAELFKLGKGIHFGEWWGPGIQRGYGVADKRFSLFNTHRWAEVNKAQRAGHDVTTPFPTCCDVVPVLATGNFSTELIDAVVERLRMFGSEAAPGFAKPEGVVVFHTAAGVAFKKTLEDDEKPKGVVANG